MKDPSKIYDLWSISKDKSANELDVVESLLQNLAIDASTLASTEPKDPPDCIVEINAARIGIEVVALVDRQARELSAKAREKNAEPGRENKLPEFYAEWSKESFKAALVSLVGEKEKKILAAKINGKAASLCDSFWLVIHTDEFTLNSACVRDYISGWKLNSKVFDRIHLILSYEPGRTASGYPHFTLE